jgi:lipopolysaccharide transport system ATP-binding protein
MNNHIIEVNNLSKQYHLGAKERINRTLREAVTDAFTAPVRNFRNLRRLTRIEDDNPDTIWALKDISFQVQPGEIVGIIGRNGAGKSTLLKVLSRITEPTSGEIKLHGRVASLLEVGTGFHPELTGRENIYLNGTILGMRKNEIDRKFDEIVAFSEIEKFLDTPVKRYSSGMYVRLAFAVAAHLEPEIMLVDEVLAVGDAAFQKKCLGKMGDVAKQGRTVLFVSHNMAAVENLCERGILLHEGHVVFIGSQEETIGRYLKSLSSDSLRIGDRKDRRGSGEIRVTGIEFRDLQENKIDKVRSGQSFDIYLHYNKKVSSSLSRVIASINIKTNLDIPVFLLHNRLTRDEFGSAADKGAFVCRIEHLPLPPSSYHLTYSLIQDGMVIDALTNASDLTVIEGDFFGSPEVPPVSHGLCLVQGRWRHETH